MGKFEKLEAFQAAIDLMVEVYRSTDSFPTTERYGLASQMRRASVSVVSHIGEGQGRLTVGEWRQMLSLARGSIYEVEAQCIASSRLGFLNDEASIRKQLKRASQLLEGLIRYVKKREEIAKKKR